MPKEDNKVISELQWIKGVGPVKAKALADEGIKTAADILFHTPRAYIDRNTVPSLKALAVKLSQEDLFESGDIPNSFSLRNEHIVIANISKKKIHELKNAKKMLILTLDDGFGGSADVIFWNYINYYEKSYPVGTFVAVMGKAEIDNYNKVKFHQPEIEKITPEDEQQYRAGGILPVYRMTQKMKNAHITLRLLRRLVSEIISREIQNIKENLSQEIIKKYTLIPRQDAVRSLHFPENAELIEQARYRMKFEEIFFFELFLAIKQKGVKTNETAPVVNPKSARARKLYDSLPFKLTSDQRKVLRDIAADMEKGAPMNRLLQGDVGSGKTIVALLSMLMAIDSGCQVAIMVPTEILAEQHYHVMKNYLKDLDAKVVQLVGGQKARFRKEVLEDIATGKANLVVGTHAMFESNIEYNNLGLIVIDEQHRFGVAQRAQLKRLGESSHAESNFSPHILVMSATPIPRTLSMTVYGDLDVSVIKEMPANRQPIQTKVVFESQLPDVYKFIENELKKGRQAFIVYPLVEKSEKLQDLKAATEYYQHLAEEIFPQFKCGLLHGQMFWYEKEDAMKAFLSKEFNFLVATTVIEVGIDIPNATVMLINNAERFGLAALHQLRGRVGRGSEKSYCFLATKDNYSYEFFRKDIGDEDRKAAIIRLKTMAKTTDGFYISDVDLKLRGPGDMFGKRQSGMPDFKFLELASDGEIISAARTEAFSIIQEDPHLRLPENQILRKEFLSIYKGGENFFDVL